MEPIKIPKKELKYLYENKKSTISKIAKYYNCSISKLWTKMKEYGIEPSRTKTVHILERKLKRLYLKKGLSTRKIAQICNCGKSTIQTKLKKYGIAIRNKSEALKLSPRGDQYKISKEKIEKLYKEKKLSAYKIADLYDCSPSVISAKLIKFNIPRRSDREGVILTNNERCPKIAKAVIRYTKKDFNGTKTDKAYLIGFRLGDLHTSKRKYGETVYISTCSTKREQIILMNQLFRRFGHVRVNKSKKNTKKGKKDNYYFIAYLNPSFDFLLNKEDNIEKWILERDNYFLSFLGGYIDAEGSFGVYNGFGAFALGSYDKNIICQIHNRLSILGIKTENPRIMVKGGYVDKRGVRTFKDLWSFKIRRKNELYKFVNIIELYLKHLKRRRDLLKVKQNITSRI